MNKKQLPVYRGMSQPIQNDAQLDHSIAREAELRQLLLSGSPQLCDYLRRWFTPEHFGRMSRKPDYQRLFTAVTVLNLLCRFAIEGGVNEFFSFGILNSSLQRLTLEMEEEQMLEAVTFGAEAFAERLADHRAERTAEDRNRYSPLVERTIRYVLRNLRSRLTVAEISRELYISADYLSNRFHKETGETLHHFIRRHKIETAKEMLRDSNLTGSEMFLALGFANQSHLIKAFKAETGMTPQEYRRQFQPSDSPFFLDMHPPRR